MAAVAVWAALGWILLAWTATVEQAVVGAVVALLVGVALAPLGPVARPWLLLDPRRLARLVALAVTSFGRVVKANVGLARRIWSPSLPLRSGMLVLPTEARTDGAVTGVSLVSSVIVDNQLVDLEPGRLQYHAVWVTTEDPAEARRQINGSLERLLVPLADGDAGGG
ncbi:MAG: Na+/H+ antiporter subunit E [Acidimicrobiales bacterium]